MATAGYGLIETIRVREGRIPFLERHLARLDRSLSALGLPRPSQEVAALVSLIVTINAWNAIGVSTRAWIPGSYQA